MSEKEYTLKETGIQIIGSHFVRLDEKIRDEDLHEYYIIDREDFIDTLIDWISEAKESDKTLMKQDLKELVTWKDEYIFSSNCTNKYIGEHSEAFESTCEALIELNSTLK